MKKMMMRFLKDEDGVTIIEYSLIAALIAVAAVVTVGLVGDQVDGTFETIQTKLGGTAQG